MKYYVEVEGKTFEVEVDGDAVRLDGRTVAADLKSNHGSPLWHLVMDGRSHTLRAHRADGRGAWRIEVDGRRHRVLALDERNRAIRDLTGSPAAAGGPFELKAPMPGLIIAVEVGPDESVERGQGLIVIEAMKMENELKASASGKVTDVRVSPGQTVDKGETLLVIDPASGER